MPTTTGRGERVDENTRPPAAPASVARASTAARLAPSTRSSAARGGHMLSSGFSDQGGGQQ